jgi:hypothetical protein
MLVLALSGILFAMTEDIAAEIARLDTVTKGTVSPHGKCYIADRGSGGNKPAPVVGSNPAPVIGSNPVSGGSDCLSMHNTARANAGLALVSWSASLAAGAQSWANTLNKAGTLYHSSGSQGENLYYASAGATCQRGVGVWLAERRNYGGGSIGSGNFGAYGHFTQIMFPTVTQIGCAVVGQALVCRYDRRQVTGTRLTRY